MKVVLNIYYYYDKQPQFLIKGIGVYFIVGRLLYEKK